MAFFADILEAVFERRLRRTAANTAADGRPLLDMAVDLVGTVGETSGLAMAQEIIERYQKLDDAEKLTFFQDIARSMNIDPEAVRTSLAAYEKDATRDNYRAFAKASEPPRQEFIRRLNMVSGATGALVRMRADLLRLGNEDPGLQALDLDFRHLFSSWFNRGFLVLRPINWESPAHILEKIIAYEAVHAIDSWDDLRRRLEPADRRCFAFFHPSMPAEPLIFVEVALTTGIPASVQDLLARERTTILAEDADTAVFYSISNCQPGLASISFGNSLIKQVASDLATEQENLSTFVTLSPIPNLCTWLKETAPDWNAADQTDMRALAAHYLLNAKSKSGSPYDPVARFHLRNGAVIHDVHAGADVSDKGLSQSFGTMVNYRYDLHKVEQNHEKFVTTRDVPATKSVQDLAASVARVMDQ